MQQAIDRGWYTRDRVNLHEMDTDDPSAHFGIACWAARDRYIYEVEPVGEREGTTVSLRRTTSAPTPKRRSNSASTTTEN